MLGARDFGLVTPDFWLPTSDFPRFMTINRRTFLQVTTAGIAAAGEAVRANFAFADADPKTTPILKFESSPDHASIPFLSWDTEGGDRAQRNLLRSGPGVTFRVKVGDVWREAVELPTRKRAKGKNGVEFGVEISPQEKLQWFIDGNDAFMMLDFSRHHRGKGKRRNIEIELVFPFDPRMTPVTAIPSDWRADCSMKLPAVISAPDFGQMVLDSPSRASVEVRVEGSRKDHTVDLTLRFPTPDADRPVNFTFTPLHLAPPAGLKDAGMWKSARRGWYNLWQPSARWGEQNRPYSAPPGILANNVVSDPASCSLWFYSDSILWTPKIASSISAAKLVRRSVDWWLDQRTRPSGEVICYWDYGNFLDSNAGVLISAWDYVEATGDLSWLRQRIERLEFISDFLARRDIDNDGMVEAIQSGNRNTLVQPARSCCWVDAVNCGHKDGYSNAVIYRSWRCLADLERKLDRRVQQARYTTLAVRLKETYAKVLFNPDTGWLGWWRSADGELHDYASPLVNSLAIEYGLVEPERGDGILTRLRAKMQAVGFTRFDLGVPLTLIPIHRSDYLLPHALGLPEREDGTDTFQQYQNGGINGMIGGHFIAAEYVAGRGKEADKHLNAMLTRQSQGKFQNGVVNKAHFGGEWNTWDGQPCGYEGYLADMYYFLLGVVMREPELRARILRPLEDQV